MGICPLKTLQRVAFIGFGSVEINLIYMFVQIADCLRPSLWNEYHIFNTAFTNRPELDLLVMTVTDNFPLQQIVELENII